MTLLSASLGGLLWVGLAAAAAAKQGLVDDLRVSISTSAVRSVTGESFSFTSTIANEGAAATPALVANLNFVSLDGSVYIDPEDWSPDRTLPVPSIAPGASTTQSWTVNPVLAGDVAVYLAVIPAAYDVASTVAPATSPAIHLHVDARRSLNPGGVLPVVLAVPGVLTVATIGLQLRRRVC